METNDMLITPNRRQMFVLTGVAAMLSGFGLAHWKMQSSRLSAPAERALWGSILELADGTTLDVSTLRGRPLVINFWATWCPPCVEELPLLDAFHRQNHSKGWQMIGIGIDQPSMIRRFLAQRPVSYPVALGGLHGTQLGEALGNPSGALPFTLVLAADGRLIMRKSGQLSAYEIEQWTLALV